MDPVPIEDQTWSVWTILAYWSSDLINLSTWQTAGSILAVGLSWREAIPCMVVGTTCIAVPMVLNGAIGSRLHVPFSVITAGSFGYYLRYFAIVSRAILAMFWMGIQGTNGAVCVSIMLTAWAPSYRDIPNALPESAGITTAGMCSYFLFWLFQLPLLLIHPTKLRPFLWVKLVVAPVTALGTLGWAVNKAGSSGDLWALQPEVAPGSATYAWLWLSCMSSVTGSWATLAVNIPDFTRYSKSVNGQFVQGPFIPVLFTLCGILGIITTSATKVFTGEYLWNPLDVISLWLDYGSGGRCAAFFAALSWFIATVGTNATANSISAANDLTVLFPRWVNIKRGCIIAAIIGGWVLVPWKILSSAMTFLSFMGGYAGMSDSIRKYTLSSKKTNSPPVFLAPISGIMTADYWLVKKQRYDLPALYDPLGRYRFIGGCNWRAAVAFIVPVTPLLPGLGYSISGPSAVHVNDGILNLYTFDWLFGYVVSIVLYAGLSWAVPAKEALVSQTIWNVDLTAVEGHGSQGSDAENQRAGEKGAERQHVQHHPPDSKVL
jgi:nucleobase:cation symporter-1, NCS1 family